MMHKELHRTADRLSKFSLLYVIDKNSVYRCMRVMFRQNRFYSLAGSCILKRHLPQLCSEGTFAVIDLGRGLA